ncbi:Processing alpha glucosidase I, partial [Ascosphaera atra]
MQGYGWDEYDIREGGRQVIHDTGNSLDLTIDFVKVPGGDKGGSWGARIKGQPQADADPEQLSTVIFVATMEGDGKMRLETPVQPEGYEGDVNFAGATPELGDFKLDVTRGPESNEHPVHDHPSYQDKPLNKSFVSSMLTPVDVLWQSRKIVFLQIRETVKRYLEAFGQDNIPPPAQLFTIPNQSGEEGNSFYVQKVFKGTFEFDILFSSGAAEKPLTSKSLTQRIKDVKKSFSARFHKAYAPVAPFNTPEYEDFSKA